jgi:hypothetical protein
MADAIQRIMMQLADVRRRMANTFVVGTVHEVSGDQLRMVIGKDDKGKEVLSPWLDTSNHRGGATEARFYKKGQTLQVVAPNGDIAQGSIAPYAPNKKFERPEHANENSDGEESYQLEDYRQKQSKDGVDMWLQDEGQKQGGGKKSKEGHTGGDKAKVKMRMNKDGGITHRVGKDNRVAAHKQGAKIRSKTDWVVVTDGMIIMSKPPRIAKDPIPNDDK